MLIGSSTSGLLPSEFYAEASHPERAWSATRSTRSPAPLVEVVGGERTAAEAVRAAMRVYESGMRPLHVRKEVPGFIADRLLEALWREALHLVNERGHDRRDRRCDPLRRRPALVVRAPS